VEQGEDRSCSRKGKKERFGNKKKERNGRKHYQPRESARVLWE